MDIELFIIEILWMDIFEFEETLKRLESVKKNYFSILFIWLWLIDCPKLKSKSYTKTNELLLRRNCSKIFIKKWINLIIKRPCGLELLKKLKFWKTFNKLWEIDKILFPKNMFLIEEITKSNPNFAQYENYKMNCLNWLEIKLHLFKN